MKMKSSSSSVVSGTSSNISEETEDLWGEEDEEIEVEDLHNMLLDELNEKSRSLEIQGKLYLIN